MVKKERGDRFEDLERRMAERMKPKNRDISVSQHQDVITPKRVGMTEPFIAMTVRLPKALWERAHMARIKTRKAVNQLIVEALGRYLGEMEKDTP